MSHDHSPISNDFSPQKHILHHELGPNDTISENDSESIQSVQDEKKFEPRLELVKNILHPAKTISSPILRFFDEISDSEDHIASQDEQGRLFYESEESDSKGFDSQDESEGSLEE